MVFELYGCPGVGKSTVVRKIEELFHEKGIQYLNYNDVFYNGNKTLVHKLWNYVVAIINPVSYPVNICVIRSCVQLKCNLKYGVYLMTLCARIKSEMKKNTNSIILLEEGIIQFISSLSHGKEITSFDSIPALINSIIKSGISIKAVECKLSLDENVKRLTERGPHSRFEDVRDHHEMVMLLEGKKRNVDYVSSFFQTIISLDMANNAIDNADKLFEILCSYSY